MATAVCNNRASYDAIKNAFNNTHITSVALEQLKNHFQADIASKRLRECIRSVPDLLHILERRDVISEYDINALYIIADHCMDMTIKEYLNNYIPPNSNSLLCHNEYRELRLAESLRENLHLHSHRNCSDHAGISQQTSALQPPTTLPVNNFTAEKKVAVYKMLSKCLGTYWRRFGRELDINEGDMDSIEEQFPRDLTSKIFKLMQIFEDDDTHDPKRHVLIICRALDQCQRKDLRRKVEEIMSH